MAVFHKRFALGAMLALSLVIGTALFLWGFPKAESAGKATAGTPAKSQVRVTVVKPQRGGVERTVTRPGVLHAYQYAELYGKVSGFLHEQQVDIGAEVKKGQMLARIYAPEIEANVTRAQADLAKAKSKVDVMQALVEEAKADLTQAEAKLEQAKADVQSATAMTVLRQEQHHRIKGLWERKAIEEELVDEKREALRAAQATETSTRKAEVTARAGVAAARARITRSEANLADARAGVQVAQAMLANTQAFEEYTWIRSPYNGVISQRNYHEGDLIRDAAGSGVGTKPVLVVNRVDLMRVVVWVPDPDVPFTRQGRPAVVRVDAMPHQSFKGQVARTALAEDPTTRTMRTEIDLPNPDGLLTPGMYGNVTIFLGKTKTSLTVPSAALVGDEKEGMRSLFVVRDDKAHALTVHVGRDDGIHAEVLSGLKADDQVIVQHGPGLEEGAQVNVVSGPGHQRGGKTLEKAH
jgi:HlyD family secretion protein